VRAAEGVRSGSAGAEARGKSERGMVAGERRTEWPAAVQGQGRGRGGVVEAAGQLGGQVACEKQVGPAGLIASRQ
jgi:hypothetical protein